MSDDNPTEHLELLHKIVTGSISHKEFISAQQRPGGGLKLLFENPDSDARVYMQLEPVSFQTYNEIPVWNRELFLDASWDDLCEITQGEELELDELKEYADEHSKKI